MIINTTTPARKIVSTVERASRPSSSRRLESPLCVDDGRDARPTVAHADPRCRDRQPHSRSRRQGGIALMEVVAALTIFVITAMFVLGGFASAQRGVMRAKLEAVAADFAVTVLSDVQMRTVPLADEPPVEADPEVFPGWTYELLVSQVQDLPDYPDLKRVEIIVRNSDANYTHRVTQFVWDTAEQEEESP